MPTSPNTLYYGDNLQVLREHVQDVPAENGKAAPGFGALPSRIERKVSV